MSGEPGLLALDEFGGVLAEIANGFEGQFAGDVVCLVVRCRLDAGGPAVGGLEKLGERFADVTVASAVIVEVVLKLVRDGGELFKEIVRVLFAARTARFGEEVMDGDGAIIEETDEGQDTITGSVSRFAKLLDLGIGEGMIAALCVERRVESEKDEGETCASQHSSLLVENLIEELVLDLIELFERSLNGGPIVTRC